MRHASASRRSGRPQLVSSSGGPTMCSEALQSADRTVYLPGQVGFADVPFRPIGLAQSGKG